MLEQRPEGDGCMGGVAVHAGTGSFRMQGRGCAWPVRELPGLGGDAEAGWAEHRGPGHLSSGLGGLLENCFLFC